MSDTVVGGRYRLGARLGSGGMGRVWLALDQVLHRSVAVKEVLLPEGLSEAELHELRLRTLREARTAARLNHPNVVRVYDAIYDDDRPWIVMEYVPSRALGQILTDHGPLSPERTARVGLALVGALAAAHRAGVLHRDVKPGNVLLADDGRVMLTDFGLATFEEVAQPLTQSGVVLGSPQFIAPERAQDGTSSPEADLWSLGATLYAAVEGRSPYSRPSSFATLTALATVDPDPPRRAGDLAPVLLGLLRRDPAARLTLEEAHDQLARLAAADAGRGWFVLRPRIGDHPDGHPSDPRAASGPPASSSGRGSTGVAASGGATTDGDATSDDDTTARGAGVPGPPAVGSGWGRVEWPTPDPFEPVTTAFPAQLSPAPPAWPPPAFTRLPGDAPDPATDPSLKPAHPGPDAAATPPAPAPPADGPAVPVPGELPRRTRPEQPPGWPTELLDRATPPEAFATFDALAMSGPAGPDLIAVSPESVSWTDPPARTAGGPSTPPATDPPPPDAVPAPPSRPPDTARGDSAAPAGPVRPPPRNASLPRGRRRAQPTRRFGLAGPAAIGLALVLLVAGIVYTINRVTGHSAASPSGPAATSPAANKQPNGPPPDGDGPPPGGPPPGGGPPPAHLSWMCAPTSPFVTENIPAGTPAAGTAGLPGGWNWITFVGQTGYRMIVPSNWRMAPDDATICFYAPDNSQLIGINQWTVTATDPVAALRERETAMRNNGGLPEYRLLGFTDVTCPAPVKCAEWDYLYRGPIGDLRVRTRDFLDGSGQAFELSWSTFENVWDANQPIYNAMVDAFELPKKKP